MRHEPLRVHRVAGKPATQVIVDAAGRHAVQRQPHHIERTLLTVSLPDANQKLQIHRMRKLRRLPKPAVRVIERPPQLLHCSVNQFDPQAARVTIANRPDFLQLGR